MAPQKLSLDARHLIISDGKARYSVTFPIVYCFPQCQIPVSLMSQIDNLGELSKISMGSSGVFLLWIGVYMRKIQDSLMANRWYLLWSVVMVLLTTAPHVAGYIAGDDTWHFEGTLISTNDNRSYLAKMRQGYDGAWSWQMTYTHEPHSGGPFYQLYLLLGKFCRLTGLPLIGGYHIARILGTLFLCWACYYTLIAFVEPPAQRKLAFWLALFGSGWGWLWLLLGGGSGLWKMPVDLWVPDGYVWFTALMAPHYAFSHAFLLLTLGEGLRFVKTGRSVHQLWAALWLLLTVSQRPYSILLITLLLGLWLLVEKWGQWRSLIREALRMAWIVLPSVPYLLWVGWLFLHHPVFREWARQATNPSPPPWFFLLGYAPSLLLALPFLFSRRQPRDFRAVYIWAVVGGLIVYVPLSAQRRFLEGWEFPLAILAAGGLLMLYNGLRISQRWRRVLVACLMLGTALTTLLMVLGAAQTAISQTPVAFIHRDEVALYAWLEAHTTRNDVVLAGYRVSNRVPVYTSARVVWGLETETVRSEEKATAVAHFYDDHDGQAQRSLLCDWSITYLVWGPEERAMGTFDPQALPVLYQVGVWGEWALWAVEDNVCDAH